jgi:hypothetical protein
MQEQAGAPRDIKARSFECAVRVVRLCQLLDEEQGRRSKALNLLSSLVRICALPLSYARATYSFKARQDDEL